jgi:hypothetical protein
MRTTTARLLLPWLSLPLVAAAYLLLWDRLPERLAVHFGPGGDANGWMTRGQSLGFDLAVLAFVLVASAFKLRRQSQDERRSGLLILNAVVLFITLLFLGLLKYNVTGSLF